MKNKKGGFFSYYLIDFERAFLSTRFVISFIGIAAVLFWCCLDTVIIGNSVLHLIWWSTYSMQFVLVMIFCAIPYTGSFCEDLENLYCYPQLLRGKLSSYCISKVGIIALSSIITMVIGMFLFTLLLKMYIPWVDSAGSVYQSAIRSGAFHTLLINKNYYLYIFFFSVQYGILTAILSLISAYISLFIANKLLVLSIPVMAFYTLTQYSTDIFGDNSKMDLTAIYGGRSNVFQNDFSSFLYAIILGIVSIVILGRLIYVKMRRRVSGD